jgi:hypothetical protein
MTNTTTTNKAKYIPGGTLRVLAGKNRFCNKTQDSLHFAKNMTENFVIDGVQL